MCPQGDALRILGDGLKIHQTCWKTLFWGTLWRGRFDSGPFESGPFDMNRLLHIFYNSWKIRWQASKQTNKQTEWHRHFLSCLSQLKIQGVRSPLFYTWSMWNKKIPRVSSLYFLTFSGCQDLDTFHTETCYYLLPDDCYLGTCYLITWHLSWECHTCRYKLS